MAKISKDEILKAVEEMSVSELAELVKALEEKFGVSAAPAAVVAPAGGGTTEEKKEEQTTFNVLLATVGSNKIGVIKAAIYVPRADIISSQGRANIDLYGSAMSYSMSIKTNTNFHYDEALGEISNIEAGPPKWKIITWQEVIGD